MPTAKSGLIPAMGLYFMIANISANKLENADKKLNGALIFCVFMGLLVLGFVLVVYLKHFLEQDWNKPVPVDVFQSFIQGTRVVVYTALPAVGAGYILVGYRIWNYRRKRNSVKENDEIAG